MKVKFFKDHEIFPISLQHWMQKPGEQGLDLSLKHGIL